MRRAPAFDVVLVEEVGHLRAETARLRQHGSDDKSGCPPQQVPDEGPPMQKPITGSSPFVVLSVHRRPAVSRRVEGR
jgi:hypothetical protein